MGVLDFLFEGKPPKSVTTYGQTVENVPKWLSDYTQGLVARANAAAAEPYIPYGGPRIAGFTPDQEAGFEQTRETVGAYEPYLGAAGAGAGLASTGLPTGLGFLEEAGGSTFPGNVEQYMNPYVQNVLDRQESLATRNLEENFLPSLQRRFAGAGQYGSRGGEGSMEDIGVRGLRDISENLEEQRLATLGQAYGQAADIYGRDVQRRGDVGARLGVLGMQGIEELGGLGEFAQQAGLTDAAALEAIGAQQQQLGQSSADLAYRDFLEQRELPFDRLGFMSEIIRGLPTERATTRTDVGPSQVYQPSGLSQIIGAYGAYKGLTSAEGGYIEPERYAEGGLIGMDDVIEMDPADYEVSYG